MGQSDHKCQTPADNATGFGFTAKSGGPMGFRLTDVLRRLFLLCFHDSVCKLELSFGF
jgi:hypothetical protein